MQGRPLRPIDIIQVLSVIVLIWLLVAWKKTPWGVERYIGTILVIVGASMIAVARYQLGRSFSVTPQARELVTSGLYSKIRNPIYVFGTVAFAGLVLVLRQPVLWLLLGVVVIVQTIRAHCEARVLEEAFGDSYREYRRKTWF